jgi:hypothetical protein
MTWYRTMSRKKIWKKVENPRVSGQNKLQPLGNFSHMDAYRISSKNTRKMDLQPILNKTSPWAHMELEFDVLGVAEKLV